MQLVAEQRSIIYTVITVLMTVLNSTGGTVNAKHLLITGQDDDALDWTNGWTGKLQHVVIKHTTSGDNCIEADNLGANPVATPEVESYGL